MQISAKNQIEGKVTSVIHGTSYSQVAVEQTDADEMRPVVLFMLQFQLIYVRKWNYPQEILSLVFFLQQLLFLLSTTKLTVKKFCGNSSQSILANYFFR